MVATVEEEKRAKLAAGTRGSFSDMFSIMRGTDGWRFLIALWPKLMQQFVGLTVVRLCFLRECTMLTFR